MSGGTGVMPMAVFYHQVLGTIPGWLTLAALLVTAWLIYRGGGGQALDVLERANRVLTEELKRRDAKEAEQAKEIAELRATRSLEAITDTVVSQFDQQQKRAETRQLEIMRWAHEHEAMARQRHERTMQASREIGAETVAALREVANGKGE